MIPVKRYIEPTILLISSRVDESVEEHLRGGVAGEDGTMGMSLDTLGEQSNAERSISSSLHP